MADHSTPINLSPITDKEIAFVSPVRGMQTIIQTFNSAVHSSVNCGDHSPLDDLRKLNDPIINTLLQTSAEPPTTSRRMRLADRILTLTQS